MFELVYLPSLIFNRHFCFFGPNLLKKSSKLPKCETLCWLIYEMLMCFTSHRQSEIFWQENNPKCISCLHFCLVVCYVTMAFSTSSGPSPLLVSREKGGSENLDAIYIGCNTRFYYKVWQNDLTCSFQAFLKKIITKCDKQISFDELRRNSH